MFKKTLFLVTPFLVAISIFIFLTQKNIQKNGSDAHSPITTQEINHYLNVLNTKRHDEQDKKVIREKIINEFQKSGYDVLEQNTGRFVNIIAYKGDLSSEYELVGAHYDTVPHTHGMDDNASGVAALLAIAKHTNVQDVRFVAFDGEEYNLSGSRYYVQSTKNPRLAIILETLGYYSDKKNSQTIPPFYSLLYRGLYNRLKENSFAGNFSAAVCTHSARQFCERYESYASVIDLSVYSVYIPSFSLLRNMFLDLFRSDHAPFLLENVPSVMITDTANFRNPNYHKSSDTIKTLNPEFIAQQANAVVSFINFSN